MRVSLKIEILHPEMGKAFPLPAPQTAGSAGVDLVAAVDCPIHLPRLGRRLIPCGFAVELPPGHEAQIRPRSGLALKQGVTVLNAPGTIDSDYRGEVMVLLVNLGEIPWTIYPGHRIAQMVISPVVRIVGVDVSDKLSSTKRGDGGFGSTGA